MMTNFTLYLSSKTEGIDYVLRHPVPIILINAPVSVTVRILNDSVVEGPESIILTLVQDMVQSPSNVNQILLHDTVQITVQDIMDQENDGGKYVFFYVF